MKLNRRNFFRAAGGAAAAALVVRGAAPLLKDGEPETAAIKRGSVKVALLTDGEPLRATVPVEIRAGETGVAVYAVGESKTTWETDRPLRVHSLKIDASAIGFPSAIDPGIQPVNLQPHDTITLKWIQPIIAAELL